MTRQYRITYILVIAKERVDDDLDSQIEIAAANIRSVATNLEYRIDHSDVDALLTAMEKEIALIRAMSVVLKGN